MPVLAYDEGFTPGVPRPTAYRMFYSELIDFLKTQKISFCHLTDQEIILPEGNVAPAYLFKSGYSELPFVPAKSGEIVTTLVLMTICQHFGLIPQDFGWGAFPDWIDS